MEYRRLGRTEIRVSALSFGAGPVSQLLTGQDTQAQRRTVGKAIESGINWFDTAATYGDGTSEQNLGDVLADLHLTVPVHVATKVRIRPVELGSLGATVRASLLSSLKRLGLERVTLLQIHNSITERAGSQPTSITPSHVLDSGGILETMERLRAEGLVEHLGLTGLGDPSALETVLATGRFATLQIPYNLLNPSAGTRVPADFSDVNYGNLIAAAARQDMGVFAIRVLAGGALAGHPPSPHTLKTPFFPLDVYQRDVRRAAAIAPLLSGGPTREEAAVRFALSHPAVSSAIVGFATPEQVGQAVDYAANGPLDAALVARLNEAASSPRSGGL